MRINSFIKLPVYVVTFVSFIFIFAYLLSSKVGASPVPATNVYPTPGASSQRIYMSVGKGDFDSQLTGVAVTVSQPGTYTAVVREATHCNLDSVYGGLEAPDLPNDDFGWVNGGFETIFMMIRPPAGSLDFAGGTFIGSTGTGWGRDCVTRNRSFNFTVTAGQLRPELENRYLSFFAAAIGADNPAYPLNGSPTARTNAFDLVITGGPGDAKVLPMSNYMNLSNRARDPLASRTSTIDIDFAIPCEGNNINARPRLFDLDTSGTIQPNPLYLSIERFRRDNNASAGFVYPRQQLIGPDDATITLGTLQFERDYWYKARLTGLYHLNAIGYTLGANTSALAEIYAQDDCSTPSDPLACTITLSNSTLRPGEAFTASLRFTNSNSTPFDGYEVGVNSRNIHFPGSRYTQSANEVEVANNSYNNYIVSGRRVYLRTGIVFNVPANSTRTVNISRFTEYGYVQTGAPPVLRSNVAFTAPATPGTYEFDWGLVRPGVGWASQPCQTTITVVNPPPSPTCNISNNVISGGFRLSWSSSNATSASINQGVGGVPVNGNTNVGTAARTYTMTVNGPGGSGSCQTTTIPPPAPVCNSFTFSVNGNDYRLSWNTTNATSVLINQGIGGVPVDGTRDVSQVARTYTLTASNIFNVSVTCSVSTPAPPSCTLNNDVSSGSYRVLWTTSNATRIDIDQGVGDNLTPLASGNRNVNPSVGSTIYTATVYNAPGATRNCNTTITVLPPTCNVVQFYRSGNIAPPQQILAGSRFRTEVRVNNPNPVALGINSTNYSFSPAASGDNVSNTYNGVPSIPANSNRAYHSSSGNWDDELIRINVPGTYQANWTVSYNGGALTCNGSVEVEVLPLSCVVNTLTNSIGLQFSVSVRLENPNYIPISVSRSEWSVPIATPPNNSGVGVRDSNGTDLNGSGGGSTISAGSEAAPSNLTIESEQNIVITTSGIYAVSWDIDSQYGTNPADCDRGDDAVTAQQQPYVRLYGNDVFAGGGVGNCTVSGSADVTGYGAFRGNASHNNYVGAAVQLAVFATGDIDRVLPGSQYASRGTLDALAFANDTTGGGTINDLGGGFALPLCSDDFLSIDRSGFNSGGGGNLSLSGNNSEDYERSGTVILRNGDNIPNGKRVQVYVEGDVIIANNIIYAEANNGTWTSIANIPLVRVYATGSIFIDWRVTEISGLYVAGNTIHTCSNGGNQWTTNQIAEFCNSKLTVYGAFVADNVVLNRVQGSYGLTPSIPENFDSTNIAESFVFSPELYLALLSEGTSNTSAKFDSILSLPPAF